jgi:hypothetical protein
MPFRCAAASLAREEPLTGSASTVRAFLLVENSGPWGVDALAECRLPEEVKSGLSAASARAGVRVLLVRRHRGAAIGPALRVFSAFADPVSPWLETTILAAPEALLDLDLVALGEGRSPGLSSAQSPVFCVCTHGRHDACCAERGRPVAAALAASHPDETWEVSHIGGDRFAANVLVLPDGLYYGRVGAQHAARLGTLHHQGVLDLDRLRGRSGFGFAVQAAEVAVRRSAGEARRDAVRLLSARASRGVTVAVLEVAGAAYEVSVRRTLGDVRHQLTCRSAQPDPVPAYEVLSLRPV